MARFTQFQFGTSTSAVSNINEIIGGDRTILDTTIDLFIDADGGNDSNDGSSVGQAFQSVARLKEELESYYLKGGVIRTNWVGNNTSLYDPLVITGEDLLGFGTLELLNVTATESINFTTGIGDKIDIDGSNLSNQLAVNFNGFEPDFDTGSFNIENVENFSIINSSDITADSALINNISGILSLNTSTFNLPNGILLENIEEIQADLLNLNDTNLILTSVLNGSIGNITLTNATNPAPILDINKSSNLDLINNFDFGTALDVEPFIIRDSSDIGVDFVYLGTNGVYAGTEPPISIINSQRIEFFTTPVPAFLLTGLTTKLNIDSTSSVITFDDTFTFLPFDGANQTDPGAIIDELDATEVLYDNTISGLTGDSVQEALDELASITAVGNFVKLNAPSTTILVDNTGGNDANDGFTTPVQTLTKVQEILRCYSWEGQDVTIDFSNFTSGFFFDGSGIIGINELELDLGGNTITSGLTFISNTRNGVQRLNLSSFDFNGADATLFLFNHLGVEFSGAHFFSNQTSGDLVQLFEVDKLETGNLRLTNVNVDSVINLIESTRAEQILVDLSTYAGTNNFNDAFINIEGQLDLLTFEPTTSNTIDGKKVNVTNTFGYLVIEDLSSLSETIPSTFPDNTIFNGSDYNNTISGLTSITQKTAIDEVALTRLATDRRFGLTSGFTLTNIDKTIFHLQQTTGSNINIGLPASPVTDRFFAIKNSDTSTVGSTFTLNGTVIEPCETYEIIYDGTEWIEL